MRLVAAAATDVGRVREGNEDSILHDDRLGIFAVADGMGGHQAGEVASATAIEALRAAIAAGAPVTDAVAQANTAVVDKARADSGMLGMGTTMTAAIEVVGGLRIGHVGDSRAYVLRDGILARVTDDHSLVEELVREGRITLEQAAVHPQRNVVTRALGIDEDVEVDDVALELTGGDRVLLCSDGLSGMLRDTDISTILRRDAEADACARALIDAANDAGGEDNISVVIIDVIGEEGDLPPAPLPEIGIGTTAVRAAAARSAATSAPAAATTEAAPLRARRTSVGRLAWAILPVILVLGGTFLALNWYARSQYYVGFDGEQVAVYRGVPGGFLLWDPQVEWTSKVIERGDLDDSQELVVSREDTFGSFAEARDVVDRLEDRVFPPTTSTTVGPTGLSGTTGTTGGTGSSGATGLPATRP